MFLIQTTTVLLIQTMIVLLIQIMTLTLTLILMRILMEMRRIETVIWID